MHANDNPLPKRHDPFVLRKMLVLLAFVPSVAVGVLSENAFLGGAVYFGVVTLLDFVSHYLLGLRSTTNVDPKILLSTEGVTASQFEAYGASRRWIRLCSLIAALFAAAIVWTLQEKILLEAFCLSYVSATLLGILYVRLFVNIPRPRLLRRDARYYVPGSRPRPGHISLAQYSLDMSSGRTPPGPVDF